MVCRCPRPQKALTARTSKKPASVTLHAQPQACLAYTSDERVFVNIWFTMLTIRPTYM